MAQTVHPKKPVAPRREVPKRFDPEEGTKFDSDKPCMELLDPYAMEQLAKVLTFGAKKYAAWNWAKGLSYSRLAGAALRHIFAYMRGEDLDPESGLPHTAHALCCLMFLVSMPQRHPEMDDREGATE